jgi:segregation and condensation protein A
MEISHQRFSIKGKMEEMLSLVPPAGASAPLSEIFRGLSGRAEAIATFLALLELLRLLIVRCSQTEEFAEIYLERTGVDASLANYEEAYR